MVYYNDAQRKKIVQRQYYEMKAKAQYKRAHLPSIEKEYLFFDDEGYRNAMEHAEQIIEED